MHVRAVDLIVTLRVEVTCAVAGRQKNMDGVKKPHNIGKLRKFYEIFEIVKILFLRLCMEISVSL